MSRLTLIVATTPTHGIGKNAGLPWRLPKEMQYFARATASAPDGETNAVIMGRNTWESIPPKFRPLPKRVNVVVSRNEEYRAETMESRKEPVVKSSLSAALQHLSTHSTPIHRSFIIGGASLYCESLSLEPFASSEAASPYVDRVLLTRIITPAFEDCDVFVPGLAQMVDGEGVGDGSWRRTSHEELNLFIGFEAPEGVQEEKGVRYEFQMWVRA